MKKLTYSDIMSDKIKIKESDLDAVMEYINDSNELTYDENNRIYDEGGNYIADIEVISVDEIGNNIKDILKEQDISIRKMSIDLDIDYSVAHGLASRKSLGTTALERIIEIANYLEVDIEDLYK